MLRKVVQSSHSQLSADQFDADRLGDWFCECAGAGPGLNDRGYRYFWNEDLAESVPASSPLPQQGGEETGERAMFDAAWQEILANGQDRSWIGVAWAAWQKRAAVLPQGVEAKPERFFLDHGLWHDRMTGQHMYTQDQYDEESTACIAQGKREARAFDAASAIGGEAKAVALLDDFALESEKFWWNDGPDGKSADAMNAAKAKVLRYMLAAPASLGETKAVAPDTAILNWLIDSKFIYALNQGYDIQLMAGFTALGDAPGGYWVNNPEGIDADDVRAVLQIAAGVAAPVTDALPVPAG